METKKLPLVSASILALFLFALTAAAPLASAQRPAGVYINWTIILRGPALNGMTPIGNSDYEVENTFRHILLRDTSGKARVLLVSY